MLKYRVLTALVLIPLVIFAIWQLHPIAFAIIMAAIVGLAAWEWSRLVGFTSYFYRSIYVVTILLGLLLAFWLPALPILIIGFFTLIWACFAILNYQRGGLPLGFQYPELRVLIGMFVLIPCWVGLLTLQTNRYLGPIWVLYLLVIIGVADTSAYFIGRRWGKNKLASRVSPKKTWAGFWGGLGCAFVVATIGGLFLPITAGQRFYLYILALLALIFSVVGDLMVSLLKRLVGVKDTGTILPGHGGILDRVDSILVGIIVFALGALVLGL